MSFGTLKLLPAGSEGAIEKIIQLGPTKFTQISYHVLERIPEIVDLADMLDEEERERLLGDLRTDPASELAVSLTISELWKNIAYHQPKLQPLLESLEGIGFDNEMRDAVVKVWSESGLTVSEQLRNISFSGRPEVQDIGWTLRMNVASDSPAKRSADAIVQFETDRGSKIVELSKGRLVKLYTVLQEVQKNLDVLLER